MDNLSKCMIQCKKDGFGCHYGAWRAAQGDDFVIEEEIPKGMRKCPYCGELFKPKRNRPQKYCGAYCQNRSSTERCKQRKKEMAQNEQA